MNYELRFSNIVLQVKHNCEKMMKSLRLGEFTLLENKQLKDFDEQNKNIQTIAIILAWTQELTEYSNSVTRQEKLSYSLVQLSDHSLPFIISPPQLTNISW